MERFGLGVNSGGMGMMFVGGEWGRRGEKEIKDVKWLRGGEGEILRMLGGGE